LGDFHFIEGDAPEAIQDLVVRLVKERIPKRLGFDPRTDIHVLTPRAGEPGADLKLVILGGDHVVDLDGIVVRELRPGWITLDVPPLERWADACRWLTPPQRRRIESAEFFEMLEEEVGRRYQALRQGSR
jgi:hypothetical protein